MKNQFPNLYGHFPKMKQSNGSGRPLNHREPSQPPSTLQAMAPGRTKNHAQRSERTGCTA